MALSGAMSSGISGLKAHMDALNVVGNNVANVNTFGYKAGRVTFEESIYSSIKSGADGSTTSGGINPSQVGYGVSIGSIDLDIAAKPMKPTGISSDLAIQGDGFFIIGDKDIIDTSKTTELNGVMLSRVGDFAFDSDGYLVDGKGNVVHGFVAVNASQDVDTGEITPSTEPGNDGAVYISTQLVPIRLPLGFVNADGADPDDADYIEDGSTIYPFIDDATGNNSTEGITDETLAESTPIRVNNITFDSSGKITAINEITNEVVTIGYVALATVPNPSAVTHTSGPYYQALGNTGDVSIVSPSGTISGALNNGVAGESEDGTELPQPIIGQGSALLNGFLEESGTDIATEFANMIIYQRGYQANTRIVTVTDTMLEELINMKR